VFAELLRERLGSIIELSLLQIQQLEKHFDLLNRWNRVLNLTSLKTPGEIVERHYCESLFLAAHLPNGAIRIGDIGSGAGFPGVPLAIARPECSVALIESHQRKSVFLREATRELANVEVIPIRVEDISETFDWVASRAVRFSEIEETVAKLAPNVGILGSAEVPSSSCFTWNIPFTVPWGERRKLWFGSRRST
jgi:16S rRNA (guanine(527)-N(7))-methyltransferase RsmG